jgi:hypothetical protein
MNDELDLIAKAKERAEAPTTDPEWGYRIHLDPGEASDGRYRGETVDPDNENRRVFLLWDTDGERCWSRSYAALTREIDRARPEIGCRIVIYRGDDYVTGEGNTGFAFGVETAPCDDPLPGSDGDRNEDEVPF